MPEGYNLSQNHPNPFNLSTRISYSVPKSGSVTVAVYNVLGQRVATLFSGQALAGEYEVTFNGDGLTSGIYFCRMAAPGFSRTVKMMLLK
jgi:outer membrane receptor protein involved in Fe transport